MEEASQQPKLYNPVATVLIAAGIFFGAQVAGAILISLIPLALGWSSIQADAWMSNNPWAQFLFVLFVEIITLKLIWEVLKYRKATFRTIGLNKPKISHIGYALAGFAVYFVTYIVGLILISQLLPGLDLQQEQQLGFSKTTTGLELIPIFISLVILPPLVEEIVARGFMFTSLRTRLSFIYAATITSVIFAAAHLGAAENGLLWVAGIDTFILSMVMCYVREKTGSLWSSIGIHFIKNGLAFFVLFNIAQYFR